MRTSPRADRHDGVRVPTDGIVRMKKDVAKRPLLLWVFFVLIEVFMSLETTVQKRKTHIRKMVLAALFVALAYVVRLIVPALNVAGGMLTFEFKDAILAIGALYLGPFWAFGMSIVIAILEYPISVTGIYGALMNFSAAAAFTVPASLVYRFRRTIVGAILGVVSGTITLVIVMLPLNLLIVPLYAPVDIAGVAGMIPGILFPFNFAKGLMNSGVALLLYKPVMRALHAAKLTEKTGKVSSSNKIRTVTSILVSISFVIIGAVVFFAFLGADFNMGYLIQKIYDFFKNIFS